MEIKINTFLINWLSNGRYKRAFVIIRGDKYFLKLINRLGRGKELKKEFPFIEKALDELFEKTLVSQKKTKNLKKNTPSSSALHLPLSPRRSPILSDRHLQRESN